MSLWYFTRYIFISSLQKSSSFCFSWQTDSFTPSKEKRKLTEMLSVDSEGAERDWRLYRNTLNKSEKLQKNLQMICKCKDIGWKKQQQKNCWPSANFSLKRIIKTYFHILEPLKDMLMKKRKSSEEKIICKCFCSLSQMSGYCKRYVSDLQSFSWECKCFASEC